MNDAILPTESDSPSPPPRIESARRRSAMNARVHGMTARLPDTEAEAAAMSRFADHWTKELGPDTEAQEGLIRASATAYARVERCRKIEEETIRQSALDAVARWEKKRRHAIRAKAQQLDADPVNTAADLESSSFGCEWMMRHWVTLDAKLAQGVDWETADLGRAMTLFGFYPKAPKPAADPFQRRLWDLAQLATGLEVASNDSSRIAPDLARDELRAIIAAEAARLDRIRRELWDALDGPEAEAVASKGMVDTTKEGQLRRRYAREAFSEMTRGLNLVMRIRVENGKFGDRLWWQAHPHVRKARGVTPFHHPEASPPCLIPDPRPAPPGPSEPEPEPEPEPGPSESLDSRNERPTQAEPTKHQRLISFLQNGLDHDTPASTPADPWRSRPAFGADPTHPGAPIPPPGEEPSGMRWWKTAPARA